ncbi:MAG: YqjK family protein [Sideroxydans sp.]|nr:YqjK family protein [Sideroxydans sp.]
MTRRLTDLAQRRHLLLEKIAAQRSALTQLSEQFERPLAWADSGLRTARYLHAHPAVLAGGLAAILSLRRSGLLGLARHGLSLLTRHPYILGWAWQLLLTSILSSSRQHEQLVAG